MWPEQAYIFPLSKVVETKPTIPLNVSDLLQRGPALHVAWLLSATQIASSWVDSSIVYVLEIVGMWTISTFTFSPKKQPQFSGHNYPLENLSLNNSFRLIKYLFQFKRALW